MGVEKSTQRHWQITVAGVSGLFDRKSGVETRANARRYRDGGNLEADILTDPTEHGDLTVSRAFARTRDLAVIKSLRTRVGSWQTTITAQPTDGAGVKSGAAIVYTGKLIGLTDPEADSNGGDPSTLALVFAISRVV